MTQVAVQRTVCSPREYARAFIVAWRSLYGGADPTQAQCGVLYAQWMIETGAAACWNWNIGNVKVTQGQVDAGITWIDLPGTWEMVNGARVVLKEGDPGRRFRAFTGLDVAMTEHLAFLRNRRYAPSWPFVEAGDPDGFARALKKQGYYTASADAYALGMVAHHRAWMKLAAFGDAIGELHSDDDVDTEPSIKPPDFAPVYILPDPLPLESTDLDELDDPDPPKAA